MKKIILGIIVLCFTVSASLYTQMPDLMASHWDIKGEVNGYMTKFWGLFLLPTMLAGIYSFFLIIPKIDPLKENIEKFRKYYDGFIALFCLFMLIIYAHGILWNLGMKISPNIIMPFSLGFLFFYLGVLLENAKRNWFIGIRTPWTLSNDDVWNKTNKLGGKLYKVAGAIAVIGTFFPDYSIFFILVPILSVSIYTVAYSYFEYQKLNQK